MRVDLRSLPSHVAHRLLQNYEQASERGRAQIGEMYAAGGARVFRATAAALRAVVNVEQDRCPDGWHTVQPSPRCPQCGESRA